MIEDDNLEVWEIKPFVIDLLVALIFEFFHFIKLFWESDEKFIFFQFLTREILKYKKEF